MRLPILVFFALLASLLAAPNASAQSCNGTLLGGSAYFSGPVCVPSEPKRIVVLDPTFSLGMALELGAPVVGAPLFGMSDATLAAEAVAKGVTDLGAFTEPSVEKIIALQPDLIIGSADMASTAHSLLSQLAPTVLITPPDWRAYFLAVADATGRADRLSGLFAEYDARVAALKAKLPATSVSVLRITSWDFQVYPGGPDAYGPFAVMDEVGVRRSDYEAPDATSPVKRPDWEELPQLDGDLLLYIIGGANASGTDGRFEEVSANPLWQAIPAVKAGRVKAVDPGTWMEFSGLASAHRVLDDIERLIVNGDAGGK